MHTYLFDFIVRGLIDADSQKEAIEALANITITTDTRDYNVYVDEIADIAVQEMPPEKSI